MKWKFKIKWNWKTQLIIIALLLGCSALMAVMILTPKNKDQKKAAGEVVKPLTFEEKMKLNPFYTKFTDPDLLTKNYVLAFYGHPKSKTMGIVGRMSKEELGVKLEEQAKAYAVLSPHKGVIPAIYLIYGTCQPKGAIYRIQKDLLESYINYALEKGYLIYLDHQMGRYKPEEAIKEILPYLKYPNVHLAIDAEWRTDRPMRKIGHIKGEELNHLQKIMKDYMKENQIPGKRQLVFHQFKPYMVKNIEKVVTSNESVLLIHSTSGWGPPFLKIDTHAINAKVTNIPIKAFKLWYYFSQKKGVHFDDPIMTPKEVLNLKPEPSLIIYQ